MRFPVAVYICDGCGIDSITDSKARANFPGNKFVTTTVTNTASLAKLFEGHLCPECWCNLQDILVAWRNREAER